MPPPPRDVIHQSFRNVHPHGYYHLGQIFSKLFLLRKKQDVKNRKDEKKEIWREINGNVSRLWRSDEGGCQGELLFHARAIWCYHSVPPVIYNPLIPACGLLSKSDALREKREGGYTPVVRTTLIFYPELVPLTSNCRYKMLYPQCIDAPRLIVGLHIIPTPVLP